MLVLDVSIRHITDPFAYTTGVAAASGEKEKLTHYANLGVPNQHMEFVPLVFESLGHWGKAASRFFQQMVKFKVQADNLQLQQADQIIASASHDQPLSQAEATMYIPDTQHPPLHTADWYRHPISRRFQHSIGIAIQRRLASIIRHHVDCALGVAVLDHFPQWHR